MSKRIVRGLTKVAPKQWDASCWKCRHINAVKGSYTEEGGFIWECESYRVSRMTKAEAKVRMCIHFEPAMRLEP